MIQIATTIEQSKRMIDTGIDIEESADFYYDSKGYLQWRGDPVLFQIASFQVPAWSLSALWQIVHELDKTYEFPTTLSSDDLIELLVKTICFRREYQLPEE